MERIDILEQDIADFSSELLNTLLKDKTTGKNIVWATDNYVGLGEQYYPDQEITPNLIIGNYTNVIQPRTLKAKSEQLKRTRDKAEVFTPSWVCNKQNNLVDEQWFGKPDVFNQIKADGHWVENVNKIEFPEEKEWTDYVDERRLEITCGEAPYLVSRYDTVTGEPIPIERRIGLLDRKLRVVNENAYDEEEWLKWTTRAFQSIYGFEYQGDNVVLARENLLITFIEYYVKRFDKRPEVQQIKKIATIISWNVWQMDGLKYTAPFSETDLDTDIGQINMFEMLGMETQEKIKTPTYCKIFDWRANHSLEYRSMINGGNTHGR